jgi:hypothetical protein
MLRSACEVEAVAATTAGTVGLRSLRAGGEACWRVAGCRAAVAGVEAVLLDVVLGAVLAAALGAGLAAGVFVSWVFDADDFAACDLVSCDLAAEAFDVDGLATGVLPADVLAAVDLAAEVLAAEVLAAVVVEDWAVAALDLDGGVSGAACAPIIRASDPTLTIKVFQRHADARANVITAFLYSESIPAVRGGVFDCLDKTPNVLSFSCLQQHHGEFAAGPLDPILASVSASELPGG